MSKKNLKSVMLMVEFEASSLFRSAPGAPPAPDLLWCQNHASFAHRNACEFMVYCGGTTEEFKDGLATMSEQGATQALISHVKKARDIGAAWAMFFV